MRSRPETRNINLRNGPCRKGSRSNWFDGTCSPRLFCGSGIRDQAHTPNPEKTTATMKMVLKPSCLSPAANVLRKNPAQTDVISPAAAVRLR